MDGRENRFTLVLAFATIYLVWGSTYLAIRFAIDGIPPFLMAALRFLFAGGVLYAWARRNAPAPTAVQWRSAAVIGVAMLLCGNGMVTWSEQRVPSGIAALLVATVPLWMVLLEWLHYGSKRPGWGVTIGLMMGFLGVFLLIGPGPLHGNVHIDLMGVGALMISTFSWANGSLYSRKAPLPSSPGLVAGMEMLAGGVALLIAGTVGGEFGRFHPGDVSMRSWLSLAYLSVFGSIVAFTAYVWLLRSTTPSRVATYAYVNPVIALLLGWGFGGEAMSPRIFAAAGIIILAVVLIISSRSKAAPEPAKKEEAKEREPVAAKRERDYFRNSLRKPSVMPGK